jgi:tetratricopeptide (TPR) repeat protein
MDPPAESEKTAVAASGGSEVHEMPEQFRSHSVVIMSVRIFSVVLATLLAVIASACSDPEADKQRYMASGNKFFEEKKYSEAIVEYRNAVRIDGRYGEARYKLAEAYAASGNARNAFQEYIRAADLLPDNIEVQLKAVAVLSIAGRLEDAKTRVQRVLEKDPRNVQAQIYLGNVMAGLKDIDGAIAQIEEAIQIEPSRGPSYSNLGMLRLAQGDRAAARAAFDKAVEVDPKSVQARLALAMFQLQTNESGPAEQTLRAALEIEPKNPLANRAMAALYLVTKRPAEAEPFLKAFADAAASPEATFMLADYYAAMKREPEAKAVLEPLTKQQATAADADLRIAQLDYPTDRAAAHARLDGVLTRSPQHGAALVTKASWLFSEGKRDEALNRVLTATKAAPDNARAHYLAGLIQVQMQDVPAAIASFNEVLRLNPRVAAAQLQLSRLQLAQGAAAEAVQLAESALKNAPGSAEAQLTLAGGLLAQRDLGRAEPMIAELLKKYPNVGPVHALDGMRQILKKNFAGARTAYERALQLDPRSFPAMAGLVALDMIEKKPAAALARVEGRLKQTPDDPRLLLLASRVYLGMNEQAKAEQSLRRTIELAPADSNAYALLGQLYVAQQRLPEARAEFDRVATKNPKDVAARTIAAMLSHQTNDLEDAKKRYREILDVNVNAAVAANNLAWIMAEEGKDLDEALRLAQRAAATAPNRAEIQDTLGWVYYKKELPALAIPPFEKSVEQAPDNPTYHYHLGLAHAKSGNVEQARRALSTALKLKPDYAEARELQATLR